MSWFPPHEPPPSADDDRVVVVCSFCLRASCWHGVFYCSDAHTAGTVERTVRQLRRLGVEHASHYSVEAVRRYVG